MLLALAVGGARSAGQETLRGNPPPLEVAPARLSPVDEAAALAADLAEAVSMLAAQPGVDENLRTVVSGLHQAAQKRLDAVAVANGKIAGYEQGIASAAAALSAAQASLADLARDTAAPRLPFRIDELRQALAQAEAELEQARGQLATLTDEPARRLARSAEVPQQLTRIEAELAECRNQLQIAPPPNEPELQTEARRLQLLAQRLALEREAEQLRRELSYYAATADVLPLQLELAQQTVARKTALVAACHEELARREGSRLQRLTEQVRREQTLYRGPLAGAAGENVQLVEKAVAYSENANDLATQLREIRLVREDIDRQFQTAVERYRSVGLTDALGGMLRQQRRELTRLTQQNRSAALRREDVREFQVELFARQDQLRSLADDAAEAGAILARAGVTDAEERESLLAPATSIAARRRTLLGELQAVADLRFRNMVAVDTEQRQLAGRIEAFANWIDERVIWIPSAPPFGTADWRPAVDALRWLLLPANWRTVAGELAGDLASNAVAFVPFLLGLLVLLLFRQRLKGILAETGEEAARGRCARILPTINSLAATILLASLWPMVFAVPGWTLMHGPPPGSFCHAVGSSLISLAILLAPLELLRQVCRDRGLAECHFGWPERTRVFLMRSLRSFLVLALPLMFLQSMMETQSVQEQWNNSLGRVAACCLLLVFAWYLHRIFRPEGTVFQQLGIRNPVPTSFRFRVLIHLVAAGMPLVLLVLSLLGYHFTAGQLGRCMERTLLLLILFIICGGFLLRWLLVRRRSLAMEEVRRMRLQMAAAGEGQPSPPPLVDAQGAIEKPAMDLATVSRQARELVVLVLGALMFACLWAIWRNVLPAIGILDQLELWRVTVNERVVGVTVKHVFYAAVTAAVTWLMIRNMPGLLNLAVQQFSSLDMGARYAATTLFRYLITVIGAVVALGFLQIQWAQYGWLVAAVTVGLGFGLQEIVANFVSGLILLFERPVRVGDLITIDNNNGVVTRIQMRATTVMTWDHQELIVPNKELVTGKLLNWSLSSHTNRLVLSVGVAYGSDVDVVRGILEEAVEAQPEILRDPAPVITFEEFGDSALLFRIRVYLPSLEQRLEIRHRLNSAIARALHLHGIRIPFPQRDIHIISGAVDQVPPRRESG